MKKHLLTLLILELLLFGLVWYSNGRTGKTYIQQAADRQRETLSELVSLCGTVEGVNRWGMLPGGAPYAGYAHEGNRLDNPHRERLAKLCEIIFEEYPFDGMNARYDDAGRMQIRFTQTIPEGNEYMRYYLIYIEPTFVGVRVDSFYEAFWSGRTQENYRLFDNWYFWSEDTPDIG